MGFTYLLSPRRWYLCGTHTRSSAVGWVNTFCDCHRCCSVLWVWFTPRASFPGWRRILWHHFAIREHPCLELFALISCLRDERHANPEPCSKHDWTQETGDAEPLVAGGGDSLTERRHRASGSRQDSETNQWETSPFLAHKASLIGFACKAGRQKWKRIRHNCTKTAN